MNKNKNKKTENYFAVKTIFALTGIFAIFSASCATLGGFNRSTAANLIDKDARYSKPATMTINIGRSPGTGIGTSQITVDETAEQAVPRVRDSFASQAPQLAVAEQLGFIKIYFENAELWDPQMGETGYRTNLKIWRFRHRVEITDAGKKLWTNLNLKVDEDNLPLAVRGTPDITGMKDESQTMKSVDFTYQWQPTELGKGFNENSTVFKNLPPNVQQSLKGTTFDLLGQGNNKIMDFDVPRTARAFFQKFDDGWRLGQLYFM